MMIRVVVTTVRSCEAVYRDSRDLSRPPSEHYCNTNVTGVFVTETCYRSDTRCCCRGRCLLYISRVFLLLSSLYHRIYAHGSPQLPYRNNQGSQVHECSLV